MKQGQYKIQIDSGIFTGWAYFHYKIENGITQAKSATNNFDKWTVIDGIPSGAVITD